MKGVGQYKGDFSFKLTFKERERHYFLIIILHKWYYLHLPCMIKN